MRQVFTLFGLMHSPLEGNRLFLPFGPESWGTILLETESRSKVFEFAAGYAAVGVMLLIWRRFLPKSDGLEDAFESEAENGLVVDATH